MDIILKIQRGTGKLTGTPLCRGCAHSHIITTRQEEITLCRRNYPAPLVMKTPVLDCSEYRNKSLPSRQDLEVIAWTIDVNQRQRAGFVQDVVIKPPKVEEE